MGVKREQAGWVDAEHRTQAELLLLRITLYGYGRQLDDSSSRHKGAESSGGQVGCQILTTMMH